MIFLRGRVKFLIVYAHPPPRDRSLRYEFVLAVLNDHHTSLLWYNLYWAYPLAMWHGINDPGVQELKDLFLNDISHRVV